MIPTYSCEYPFFLLETSDSRCQLYSCKYLSLVFAASAQFKKVRGLKFWVHGRSLCLLLRPIVSGFIQKPRIEHHVDYSGDDPTRLGNVPSIEDNPCHSPHFLCRGNHYRDDCLYYLQ